MKIFCFFCYLLDALLFYLSRLGLWFSCSLVLCLVWYRCQGFFSIWISNVSAPFTEKTILPLLYCNVPLLQMRWLYMCGSIWGLYFIILVYLSIHSLIPHNFNYGSLKISNLHPLTLFLFKIVFAILGTLHSEFACQFFHTHI